MRRGKNYDGCATPAIQEMQRSTDRVHPHPSGKKVKKPLILYTCDIIQEVLLGFLVITASKVGTPLELPQVSADHRRTQVHQVDS